jgi:MerR family transcriptional regulator/heat shock protein HspR
VRGDWRDVLDDPSSAIYTLGVVAEVLGVDVQLVRRYSDEGIIAPERSLGHQRRFSRMDIERLARALDLANDAIPMVGIRRILDLEDRLNERADHTGR